MVWRLGLGVVALGLGFWVGGVVGSLCVRILFQIYLKIPYDAIFRNNLYARKYLPSLSVT